MSCGGCNVKLKSNQPGVACGKCKVTFHKGCAQKTEGVTEGDWNRLTTGDILFNCKKCKALRRSSVVGNLDTSSTSNDASVAGLKADITAFQGQINLIQQTNRDVEKSLTNLHESLANIERSVGALEARLSQLDEVQAENTRLRNSLFVLEKRVKKLEESAAVRPEKVARKKVDEYEVTVSGLDLNEAEEANTAVTTFMQSLKLSECAQAISSCRLFPKKDQTATSVILVAFKDRKSRDSLIKAAKAESPRSGVTGSRVYVNEKLSSTCYKLLCKAKMLKNKGYKFIWARSGKVFVRKEEGSSISVVKDEKDVLALSNTNNRD